MPLPLGTKLGPYQILSELGAGGMGEVYRGRDTKLDREVAVKVLPASVARDPERLARFEREAKVLASLNHPNIAQIYGVQEAEGYQALVMELVPGQTLGARIKAGAIPLDETLRLAAQMVDALSAAHDKGITHRDFKPANVMITPDGVVKVLDFGLAAVSQPSSDVPTGSNVATLTMSPTSAGMIMGTAPYMSPEQARGNQADRRSDIFSFGVVLYEMLTAKQLFHGETVSDILASVLKDNPSLDVVPEQVRPLLQRCLQKDPKKRLQSIGDWDLLLDRGTPGGAAFQAAAGLLPGQTPAHLHSRFGAVSIAAAVFAIAAIALGIGYYRATQPAPLKPLTMFEVDLGTGSQQSLWGASAILSPDGRRLVYVSNRKLYTRELDELTAREIPGTDGGFAPFFSPDGKWVGFFTATKLKKIEVDGGAAIDLCDARSGRGGAWGDNGLIAATLEASGPLMQIPENGGAPVALTRLEEGETTQRYPQMLPGGKAVLYTGFVSNTDLDGADIAVTTLSGPGHRRKVLHRGGSYARYVPTYGSTGHLTFLSKGALYAVPFDPQTLETLGTPVRVLDGVAYSQGGTAEVSFADGPTGPGTLVYRRGGGSVEHQRTIQWLDSSGKAETLPAKPDVSMYLKLSPGSDRVAYSITDTWAYDMRRDTTTRLSFDGGQYPLWTPDGQFVVYRRVGEGLLWTRADGGGKPQLLVQSNSQIGPTSFTPDGKTLAYYELISGVGYDLWTVPVEIGAAGLKAGKPAPLLRTKFNERWAAFSPDGHWVAYASDESGSYQIYVRSFPDNGSKWQVSNDGGVYPRFSGTGHELFYRNEDSSRIFVVNYAAKGDSFVADKPKMWLEKQLLDSQLSYSNYDVAPDGKRIIALMPVETPESQKDQNHVIFVENFFDELKRKAPAK